MTPRKAMISSIRPHCVFLLSILLAAGELAARPRESLVRTDPWPGWGGFAMRTTVEAGYIPAGSPLGPGTPRSSTIRTNTSQVDPERLYPSHFDAGVPTVAVTHNPDSGDAKDTAMGTAKFDYLLAAGSADDWGFDFTTTTSAVNAMVDFGSGPEPADAFVEVTFTMTSDGPHLKPDTYFEFPALPPLNDPASESLVTNFSFGNFFDPCPAGLVSGYQVAGDSGFTIPFRLCPALFDPASGSTRPLDRFNYDLHYHIITPFGTDPTYNYAGSASAALVSPIVVTNTNDSGAGSLRQAIADAVDDDVIVFDPCLSGGVVTLESGEIAISGKRIIIDATALDGRLLDVDAGNAFRIFNIDSTADLTVLKLALTDGFADAGDGGAILNRGSLQMIDCEVRGNEVGGASRNGGGIANDGGTLAMWRCFVFVNEASGFGGGIFNQNGGSVTLRDCEIRGNRAELGGGVFSSVYGKLDLLNCSFRTNRSIDSGGGLNLSPESEPLPEASVVNTTFTRNIAEFGGAIYLGEGARLNLRHSTVSDNGSGESADVYAPGDCEVTIFSSILSGGSGGDIDLKNGSLTSDGFNLVGSGESAGDFTAAGDQTGVTDPMLSREGRFGGVTSVLLPLAGSPAVDAGGSDTLTPVFDQRGLPRVVDGDLAGASVIDIGAVEIERPTTVPSDPEDSGSGSLRAAIAAVPDGGQVRFLDEYFGHFILTAGPIVIDGKTVRIDRLGGKSILIYPDATRIFEIGATADVTLVNFTLLDSQSGAAVPDGGAIRNQGIVRLRDCRFTRCVAEGRGGAIYNAAGAELFLGGGCEFSYNSASSGGAVASDGEVTMVDSVFRGNEATRGGAFNNGVGSLAQIDRCRFAYNDAGNRAGAIDNRGQLSIDNSALWNNRALILGGAIDDVGTLRMTNCTLSGNRAASGGALHTNGLSATIRHCTITENFSPDGGGIAVSATSATMFSTILSGNFGNDIFLSGGSGAGVHSLGYNFVGSGDGLTAFTAGGDRVGAGDPGLSPLGYLGGAVPTMLPAVGSPVIDAGAIDLDSPATDARGESRATDGNGDATIVADIGAVEAGSLANTHLVVTSVADSGAGSLREALAGASEPGSRITFAPALDGATIALTSGPLTIAEQSVLVDATALAGGLTLDAGGTSRTVCIRSTGAATFEDMTFTGGRAVPGISSLSNASGGGAILNEGWLTLADCVITHNSSPIGAGGVDHFGHAFEAIRTEFSHNSSESFGGGGVRNFGAECAINGCSFFANHAEGNGGGLFMVGSQSVRDTTFWNNTATQDGGAIYTGSGGNYAIDQCTLFDNSAGDRGGGIASLSGRSPEVLRCTITANTAPEGAGVFVGQFPDTTALASLVIRLCIIADNNGSDVSRGPSGAMFISGGYNLIGDGNGFGDFAAFGDSTLVADAHLSTLHDFGGPAPTVYPLPGSPAIDAGPPGEPYIEFHYDQRGFDRGIDTTGIGGERSDIGAVEAGSLPVREVVVTNRNDAGGGSLREALGDALPGTVIRFDPSLDGAVFASGGFPILVPFVKIDAGDLGDGITLNGGGSARLFEIKPTAVVELCGLTIEDGYRFDCGGGILNQGVLTLSKCTVRNCVAELRGGGICNDGGRLVLRSSSLIGNGASDADEGRGGGLFSDGDFSFDTVVVDHCTFADNSAGQFGGGIFNFLGRMDLRHSTIAYNTAPGEGAGVATFGDLSAETWVFSSIVGGNFGSDVAFVLDPSNQFFSAGHNLIGIGNAAGAFVNPGDWNNVTNPSLAPLGNYGGRTLTVLPRSNSLALEGGTLGGLTAEADQRGLPRLIDLGHDGIVLPDIGAVEVGPVPFPTATALVTTAADLVPGSLRNVLAPDIIPGTLVTFAPHLDGATLGLTGGEIPVAGLFVKIDALALPGGITISGAGTSRIFTVESQADLEVCGVTLRDGFVADNGGAIRNEGFLTLTQCNLLSNKAGLDGGAVANESGRLTLVDSTFAMNTAQNGGAIHHDGDLFERIATVEQCTFAENSAAVQGGALLNLFGIMAVRHSTISENQAGDTGGGIATNGDSSVVTRLFSTIAAGNFGKDLAIVLDPLDRYTSDGGNLIGFTDGTSAFPGTEDQVGVADPGLSPLGDYGGRALTMPVAFGSPARDAGGTLPDSPTHDQRGFPRSFGIGTDIGAYEASGAGGYPAWAAESIPPDNDRSFGGDAEMDGSPNGLEYGTHTNPNLSDLGHPNHPALTGWATIEFGFRPGATDVTLRVMRSTDLHTWVEIYRFDGSSETPATDVLSDLDFNTARISVFDTAPPQPRSFYRLEAILVP